MQSLDGTSRLPRLIAGPKQDAFGGLRPGDEAPVSLGGTSRQFHTDLPAKTRNAARASRRLFFLACLAGLIVAGLNLPPLVRDQLNRHADNLAINAGLGVDHVAIIGHNRTPMKAIVDALDLNADKSLIGYSAADVGQKLRRLPWIKDVRVTHILPTTVSLEIVEREPFAIWQRGGGLSLIDREGRVLGDVSQVPDQPFPLVVGAGAEKKAGAFLQQLASRPRVARRVVASIRVADRRWNLKLQSGSKILLPERGIATAFDVLERMMSEGAVGKAGAQLIDLRIPERPTLRLAGKSMRALARLRKKRRAARPPQGS